MIWRKSFKASHSKWVRWTFTHIFVIFDSSSHNEFVVNRHKKKKTKSISSPLLHSLTIILEITFHTKTQRATTQKKKAH